MDDDIIRPKNIAERKKVEAATESEAAEKAKQDELMMAAYADYLDELKKNSPEEYKKIVDNMMATAAANGGLDGLKTPEGTIGKDGKRTDETIPSREIQPNPGFVVKTKNQKGTSDAAKVFINICTHKAIKNFSKRVQLMEDGTEQEGLSVPCSVGPPRSETDKAGKPAVVFDVIVNPQVIQDATDDVTGSTRHWLIKIAMDRIDSKYSTHLDRRYKLPKAKYKGKVATQRIRTAEKPKIEPVTIEEVESKATKRKKKQPKKQKLSLEYCKYTLTYRDTMSSGATGTEVDEGTWSVCPIPGEGTLPNPCAADLDLDIIPAQLRLSMPLPRFATTLALDDDNINPAATRRSRVDVEVSPWMVVVKAESYHAVEVMLPYPVFCEVSTNDEDKADIFDSKDVLDDDGHENGNKKSDETKTGGVNENTKIIEAGSFFDCVYDCESRLLHVVMTVDTTALDFDPAPQQDGTTSLSNHVGPDPGSRPWLLSQAINGGSRHARPTMMSRGASSSVNAADQLAADDDDVFAEDAFHNMDAMSQHYNMQKQQGRTEREEKAKAKEEAEAKEEAKKKMEEKGQEPTMEENEKGDDSFAAMLKKATKGSSELKKTAPKIYIDRKPVEGLSLASEDDGVGMENDLIFDLC